MMVPIGLAVAFALGVDLRRIALLAIAVYLPLSVGLLVGYAIWRDRSAEDQRPAQFCEGIAAEVRAGSTLRDAVVASAESLGVNGLDEFDTRASVEQVAAAAAEGFPSIAEELRLTVVNASRSGSDVASLFDEIGSLALARAEVEREVRVATAPGRATALLLLGAPLVYISGQAMSGELERMLRSTQQRMVALVGLGLFVVGIAGASLVLWVSRR